MEDIEGKSSGQLASEDLQYVKKDPSEPQLVGSLAMSHALGMGGSAHISRDATTEAQKVNCWLLRLVLTGFSQHDFPAAKL